MVEPEIPVDADVREIKVTLKYVVNITPQAILTVEQNYWHSEMSPCFEHDHDEEDRE